MAMVKMSEIAAAAGVSRTAASFILNNKPEGERLSAATREKVLRKAKEMGYVPNRLAQAMITGNSRVVLFLGGKSFSKLIIGEEFEGIYHTLLNKDYHLHPMTLNDNWEDMERSILEKTPMAIVTRYNPMIKKLEGLCRERDLPLVVFDSSLSLRKSHRVISDDPQGMGQAVDELIQLGHRHFGFVGGISNKNDIASSIRRRALEEVLAEHELQLSPKDVFKGSYDWDEANGKISTQLEARPLKKLPTALLSTSDIPAAAMLNQLQDRGVKVPERVSIVGFGNLYHSQTTRPSLSTVSQGFRDIGQVVAERALEFIELKQQNKAIPMGRTDLLPTQWLPRQSIAPAPSL